MKFREIALRALGVERKNPELCRAQLDAFSSQIPLMYMVVTVSILGLAYTHYPHAPRYLTLYFPAFLVTFSIMRIINYLSVRHKKLDDAHVRRRLVSTAVLTILMGSVFSVWSLSLFGYGDAYTQGHVVFFANVLALGWIICLMHLRSAVIGLVLVIIIPHVLFLFFSQSPVFMAIAVSMAMVSVSAVTVVLAHYRDFANLIESQKALISQQVETQELSDANLRLANSDSLTGLQSRYSFFNHLSGRLREFSELTSDGIAVGLLDIDGFKPINDVYGHSAGDTLLIDVGIRLSEALGRETFVARLGGDEFGMVIEGNYSDDELIALGERLSATMRTPFDIHGLVANLGASVGFARRAESSDTASWLLEKADYALYHAKNNARGATILFSEEHAAQIYEVSSMERRLRDADLENEMSLAFQPIIKTGSAKAVGFEVLARWNSPILGAIPPNTFIRAAERVGLINQITEILLEKALDEAKRWGGDVFLSFNLSSLDISSPKPVLRLLDIIRKSQFDVRRIVFEVTETAVVNDYEQAVESLTLLRNLGAKVALDDFGTGFSSLNNVRTLPLDKLKVDRSFITEIDKDEKARAIVATIFELCRNLKLDCIVEGVETEEQLKVLNELGCEFIQGYLFSRPLNVDGVAKYMSAELKLRA